MKVVILCGGKGTRLKEHTESIPKPLIEIGGLPILWHIMKMYAAHGFEEFILCLGYKAEAIKEYFANYFLHMSDVTFDMQQNTMEVHQNHAEPWRVTLMDTGDQTMTGGRLRRVKDYLAEEKAFCFTYGDGVGDVNLSELITFHNNEGTLATVTAMRPPGRFGTLDIDRSRVNSFQEKPDGDGGWVNGGFSVLSPEVIDRIEGDHTIWERDPRAFSGPMPSHSLMVAARS